MIVVVVLCLVSGRSTSVVSTSGSPGGAPAAVQAGPLADAYVRAGTYAAANFGFASELIVKRHATAAWEREAYLMFDISAEASVQSAVLRLFGGLSDARQPGIEVAIHPVGGTGWTESGITWNNKPASGASALATFTVSGTSAGWYSVDLTAYVQAQRGAGSRAIALALKGTADTLPYASFGSRESEYAPQLTVSGEAPPSTAALVRGPYLQQTTDTGAVIVWATAEPGVSTVEYWTGADVPRSATAASTFFASSTTGVADYYQHEATIGGLSPATPYSYDLRIDGADLTPGAVDQLRTAPARGAGTVRFVAFGDSGTGSAAQSGLAAIIAGDTFDFSLHAGDVAYSNGTFAEFDARFFPAYGAWLRKRAFFPSIGNHDDRTAYATPYRSLFVLPENGWTPAFPDHAERYYSFDYGPLHIVVLDTERAFLSSTRHEEQRAWLETDLRAAQSQPWRIALFHRSPYSSGAGHGSELAVRQTFAPLFERYGVQFVISGHEHDYERSVPWREAGDQAVTYLVTGGGGASLYASGVSAWTALSRSVHHYMRATVSPDRALVEAVGLDGAVFDSFTLDRLQQAGDVTPPDVSIASPAPGAVLSGVETVEIAAADDVRVEKVDLWVDGVLGGIDLTAPYRFVLDTRTLGDGEHTLEARAHDLAGRRAADLRAVRVQNLPASGEVTLYASKASVRQGSWRVVTDAAAAGGARMESLYTGAARVDPPLANPADYVEMRFLVEAGRPYRLWMRGKASNDSGYRDSVWAQFSSSVTAGGTPTFRIGTSSGAWLNLEACRGCGLDGWGWQDNGFGGPGPELYFAENGVETIRLQVRESGLSIDQIVLSPATYLTSAPGPGKNDATILPEQGGVAGGDALVADAYVRAGPYASANFGSAPELVVKHSAAVEYRREAYLKLDISSVRVGDAVTLELAGWLSDARAPSVTTRLREVSDSSWSEGTVTWNTKPGASSTVLGDVVVSTTSPAWRGVDLTSFIQARRSAGRTQVTIALINDDDTLPYVAFGSRESAYPPRLIAAP